jgi:PAS domain S-box-containing protein
MKGNFDFLYSAFEDEKNILSLFDAAPQAILLIDSQSKIVLVNERVLEVLGYNGDELLGRSLDILLPPQYRDRHSLMVEKFLATPCIRQMGQGIDLVALRKGGEQIPVEIGLSYIPSSKGVLIMALVTDIRERKQLEESARKAEKLRSELEKEKELRKLKNTFIAMITHDFRNPLNVIRLTVDALEIYCKQISAPKTKHFTRVRESLHRLETMIEQVMALGRVEAGQVIFKPEPLQIHDFCQRVAEQFEGRRRIRFSYSGQNQPIMLDPVLLDHILSNLLSNAIKYSSDEQEVSLEVNEQSDHLLIKIHDQGMGIPLGEQIFQAFHRGHNVNGIPGTGLGLSIVKTYTELHGGAVSYESQENIGSTFTVTLPRIQA